MIQLHQFLVYVLKYLAEDDQITNDCSEYITLKISPHHIHKTKAEHKHAIFVLCKISSTQNLRSLPTLLHNTILHIDIQTSTTCIEPTLSNHSAISPIFDLKVNSFRAKKSQQTGSSTILRQLSKTVSRVETNCFTCVTNRFIA